MPKNPSFDFPPAGGGRGKVYSIIDCKYINAKRTLEDSHNTFWSLLFKLNEIHNQGKNANLIPQEITRVGIMNVIFDEEIIKLK